MATLPLFADTPPELTVRALREVRPDRSQDGKTWRASLVDVRGSTGDVDIQVSGTNEHRVGMTQLTDYSHLLRQEGGGVTKAWKPGAPPDDWARP